MMYDSVDPSEPRSWSLFSCAIGANPPETLSGRPAHGAGFQTGSGCGKAELWLSPLLRYSNSRLS